MNGLKALEVMKQGKAVKLNEKCYEMIGDVIFITSEDDSYPCLAFPINHEGFVLATEEVVKVNKKGRVPKGERFYCITRRGGVFPLIEKRDKRCNDYYKVGNYFASRQEAREVAQAEMAHRLSLRHSQQLEQLMDASWVRETKELFA